MFQTPETLGSLGAHLFRGQIKGTSTVKKILGNTRKLRKKDLEIKNMCAENPKHG
jgi:hypothetical protein